MAMTSLQPGLNIGDAQHLRKHWVGLPPPRSIITSPPYLDIHDYGNESKIGVRGQDVKDYLSQMYDIFSDCYHIATDDATFWVVAGSLRRNKRLISLPDRLANCAEQAGWVLRESITWNKQKALPWTHHGELRDITEQVLLFSKEDDFLFDPTDLRSPIPDSVWWRKYPERYSPDGTMPTNLWSIPIPNQGSWAGVRTHFCPFPEELTYRMISLTTGKGDVVLDPLAGIGSVPAMAEAMDRKGYGIELSTDYARRYERTKKTANDFMSAILQHGHRYAEFHRTIIELRLLKFAKLLGKQVNDAGIKVLWVRTSKSRNNPQRDHQIVSGKFDIVLDDKTLLESATNIANWAIKRVPFSKFGIDAQCLAFTSFSASTDGFWYKSGRFWNKPSRIRPEGGEPHVVAEFKPDPDMIDDIPYT